MSKLIEIYSRACGLSIGDQFLLEKFFPIPDEKIVTIQNGSGQAAKNYDFYNEVVALLSPMLSANNISIIQIGDKNDPPINGCKSLLGITNIHQSHYILKRSLLHICNDTFSAHLAGQIGTPLVAVYGSTSSWVHGPYKFDKDKTILIDSHRNGNIPSYNQENPKTINLIPPENIANAALKILGIKHEINQKTIFVAPLFSQKILEYVPNSVIAPQHFANDVMTIRLDYHFDENIFTAGLQQGRKFNVVTNKPININILGHFKENIVGLSYEVTETDTIEYLLSLKRTGLKFKFFSKETDEKKIAALRLRFFEVVMIEFVGILTKEKFLEETQKYSNNTLDKNLKIDTLTYKSNKFLISNGMLYPSKAAWQEKKPIKGLEQNSHPVIDIPSFWEEFSHFRIYGQV